MPDNENHIHASAMNGYTAATRQYVRGRPDYPPEITAWLREQLGLQAGRRVVDLGAGTGKCIPHLLETGADVIAVEPVPSMLGQLASTFPQVEALDGTAESVPLPDASVDAVVCAQSFHWFATNAALTEIHRILKPGGALGLIWNGRDESIGWVGRLNQIVNRWEGDTPRYHTGAWRQVFPFPGFGPLQERRFSQPHTGSPEDVIINRIRSTSFIAALPPRDRETVEAELRGLIASEPELRDKALITVPYETRAFHAKKC